MLEIDFGDADLINQERILEGPRIWSLCTIIGSDTLIHGRAGCSQAGGARWQRTELCCVGPETRPSPREGGSVQGEHTALGTVIQGRQL